MEGGLAGVITVVSRCSQSSWCGRSLSSQWTQPSLRKSAHYLE